MRILFAAIGAYGHLYPMMPLATACAAAGHVVEVATAAPFLGRLPFPTVPAHRADLTIDGAIAETRRRHPDAVGHEVAIAMFTDVVAGETARALIEYGTRSRPDLVVYEAMDTGAGAAAAVLGIPAVSFAIGLNTFVYPILDAATREHHGGLWTARGQPVPTGARLASTMIDPVPPGLVPSRGEDSGAQRLPIRTVGYAESVAALPAWLAVPAERPRVYLTLGTVSFGAVEVLRRAVSEIEPLDVDLLVAVGPDGDLTALGPVGPRVHVERFVDQAAVLARVDVAVHHGGTGTVLGAAEAGVPQLLLPQGADQFSNAEHLPRSGAGRALLAEQQTAGAIGEAVAAMLGDSAERAAATALRAEIAAMPAPSELVATLEELAHPRRD